MNTPLPLMVLISPCIWRTFPGRVFHLTFTGRSTGNLTPKRRQFKGTSKANNALPAVSNVADPWAHARRSGAGRQIKPDLLLRHLEFPKKLLPSTPLSALFSIPLKTTKVPFSEAIIVPEVERAHE